MEHESIPHFSYTTFQGESISDSIVTQKKVTLIDFWAPWCAPCRKYNRELSDYYHSLTTDKRANFQTISICLEKDSSKWINALRNDGLEWATNCMDTAIKKSLIVQEFNATRLPYAIVYDANAIKICEGIQGKILHEAIEEELKKWCQNGTHSKSNR